MNRKLASVILLVALVANALVAAIPAAADEPVNVDPVVGGPYMVSADDNIHLYYWFWAMARGHVTSYVKGNETSYTLRDAKGNIVWSLSAEEAASYWSSPFTFDLSEWLDYPMPYAWAVAWEYPLGNLDPGVYTLTTSILVKHPIADYPNVRDKVTGELICSRPCLFDPGSLEFSVSIIVE